MTLYDLLNEGNAALQQAGDTDGENDAKLLLFEAFHLDLVHFLMDRLRPLSEQERNALLTIAEGMKKAVPCTACRNCCDGCPKHLDIPTLLSAYNELTITPSFNIGMFVEALPADKRPDACIACGRCTRICPQSIHVPAFLRDFSDRLSKMPSWAEICRQRDAAQK